MRNLLPALIACALAACAADTPDTSEVDQADNALCLSRSDVCYDRAEYNYQSCTYGAELDYDRCVRNHGVNCEDNYDTRWDACGDTLYSAYNRCDVNYCLCEGFTLNECTSDVG